MKNVTVLGAGGMGALFGAILAEGGFSVTLVDTDSEHVEAIRKNGLHISGLGGDRYQQIAAEHEASAVEHAAKPQNRRGIWRRRAQCSSAFKTALVMRIFWRTFLGRKMCLVD